MLRLSAARIMMMMVVMVLMVFLIDFRLFGWTTARSAVSTATACFNAVTIDTAATSLLAKVQVLFGIVNTIGAI